MRAIESPCVARAVPVLLVDLWSDSRFPPSSERCRMRRLCAVALVLSLASAWSLRAAVPVPEPRPLALVGGLIRTQTDAGDFVGTIVVRDGKIVAIGPNAPVPPDAHR